MHGNAAATTNNIAAHELLFRWGIFTYALSAALFLLVPLALYRLLKGVDQTLAGDNLVRVHEQKRKQRSLLARRYREGLSVRLYLERTENSELKHGRHARSPTLDASTVAPRREQVGACKGARQFASSVQTGRARHDT